MKLLGLELSSSRKLIAVAEVGPSGVVVLASQEGTDQPFKLIHQVLTEANLRPSVIEGIAIGMGPGSYTSIRVALSIAQGWHAAQRLPIYPIATHHVIAQTMWDRGFRGRLTVGIDAQRSELYLARFELTDTGWTQSEPLHLIPATQLHQLEEHIYGPDIAHLCPWAGVCFPSAEALFQLVNKTTPTMNPEQVSPIYLRPTSFRKAPPPRFLIL